jgi:hypothetical protein
MLGNEAMDRKLCGFAVPAAGQEFKPSVVRNQPIDYDLGFGRLPVLACA